MATTKREIVRRVAIKTDQKQHVARDVIQSFLDEIINELSQGNRLEFRDFGIFDVTTKRPRRARNPRTGEIVHVPAKTVVHFKVGRLMKELVSQKQQTPGRNEESLPKKIGMGAEAKHQSQTHTQPKSPKPEPIQEELRAQV